jgi:hypothetical protein
MRNGSDFLDCPKAEQEVWTVILGGIPAFSSVGDIERLSPKEVDCGLKGLEPK